MLQIRLLCGHWDVIRELQCEIRTCDFKISSHDVTQPMTVRFILSIVVAQGHKRSVVAQVMFQTDFNAIFLQKFVAG